MKKRLSIVILVSLLSLILAVQPSYAILGLFDIVYDPIVDANVVAQTAMQAANWIQELLNQAEQIQYAIDTYLQLKEAYLKIKETYDLALKMSQYLKGLDSYAIGFGHWQGAGAANDPFGTIGGIQQAMSGIYNMAALGKSYGASILELAQYDPATLATMADLEKNRVKAHAASAAIADSAAQQALATAASVGGALQAAEGNVMDLVAASMSDNPDMNTHAALLNRINVASAMQLATQQDTNKLLSVIASSQAALLKQQRDGFADAIIRDIYIRNNFQKDWQWASAGANEALQSFKTSDYAKF